MKKILIVTGVLLIFTATAILIGCSNNKPSIQSTPPQTNNTNNTNNAGTTNNTNNTNNATGKTFTAADLAKYNGQNGNPAYVAVNGTVYDVTNAKKWNNGSHFGHVAGTDLSNQMGDSPHGTSVLNQVPVVGTLK